MSVIGLDKLQRKLNKLADEETYTKALGKSAAIVERDAKIGAAVDTGLLRSSIITEVKDLKATVGTNLTYAKWVEYGTGEHAVNGDGRQTPWVYQRPDGSWVTTRGQKPQPFLGPALSNNKQLIRELLAAEIKKEVSK